jgi:IS605 OrfB family transposase
MLKKDYSTYCTHVSLDASTEAAVHDFMQAWLHYQTHRTVDLKKSGLLGKYDKVDCDRYRKTQTFENKQKQVLETFDARYSRAIDIDIQARAESSLECKALEIEDKQIKLGKMKKEVTKALEKYKNRQSITHDDNRELLNQAYNHYYRLLGKQQKLEGRIETLEKEIEAQTVKITFGGKSFFHQQFKKGVDFKAWQEAWVNRGDRFECGGSKSEEFGNKKMHLTFPKDYDPASGKRPRFDLRILLPACLQDDHGPSIMFRNLVFRHGEAIIKQNVMAHQAYRQAKSDYEKAKRQVNKLVDKHEKEQALKALGDSPKADDFGALSFAFQVLRKNKGYYLHVSVPKVPKPKQTTAQNGVIGLDINYDNLSYANVSKQGQLVDSKVLRFNFGSRNSAAHREQMINQHLKTLVNEALTKKKDIVLERLDFTHKKSLQTKGLNKDTNRMLHSLAYRKIKENLRRLCLDHGVSYHEVNPSYTSMLGRFLYTKRYGISIHQAAAYVIARRYLQFEERFSSKTLTFLYKSRTCHLELPVRMFEEQAKLKPFQFWGKLYRWIAAEFKAPSRFYQPTLRSDSSPAC